MSEPNYCPDRDKLLPCPFCKTNEHLVQDYFAGCRTDSFWVLCENSACDDDFINDSGPTTVREINYEKGVQRAIEAWNEWAKNKVQNQ